MNYPKCVVACVVLVFAQYVCGITLYLGVTNATDTTDCGISPSFPCATLQYLLNQAVEGDMVTIENGTYADQPNIVINTENISITSEGNVVFTGNTSSPYFSIEAFNFSISGILFNTLSNLHDGPLFLIENSDISAVNYTFANISLTNSQVDTFITDMSSGSTSGSITCSDLLFDNVTGTTMFSTTLYATFTNVRISNTFIDQSVFFNAQPSGSVIINNLHITDTLGDVLWSQADEIVANQVTISNFTGVFCNVTSTSIFLTNFSVQNVNTTSNFIGIDLFSSIDIAPPPVVQLTISDCVFDSVEYSGPTDFISLLDIAANNSIIILTSISYTNGKNVNFIEFTSQNSAISQTQFGLIDINVANVENLMANNAGLLVFQYLNCYDYLSLINVTVNDCEVDFLLEFYVATETESVSPALASQIGIYNFTASNISCSAASCFNVLNQIDFAGILFSQLTLSNMTLPDSADLFTINSEAPCAFEDFSATNIHGPIFVFSYNCPNLTFASNFTYQESNSTFFYCSGNGTTLYFNSVLDSDQNNLVAQVNCTVVVQGVPLEVSFYDYFPASPEDTNMTIIWVELASCVALVLLFIIIASVLLFPLYFKSKKYTQID